MVEKAEADFHPTAEQTRALHGRYVAQLKNMARDMGDLDDEVGSSMGAVDRAFVVLRATFDAIHSDAMHQIRNGEANVLATIDSALVAGLPKGHRDALTQMEGELTRLLDKTCDLG